MRRIRQSTEAELRLLCNAIELVPTADIRGITLLVDDQPKVVVGYDGWATGSVVMHLWIEHPKYVGRDILMEAFRYPFGIADLNVVLGIVRSDNPEALRFDLGIGFEQKAVIPDAYGKGVDMHFLSMSRHTCKWYKSHDASRRNASAVGCAPAETSCAAAG